MWFLTLFLLSFWNAEISVKATNSSIHKSCSYWSEWINDHHPNGRKAGSNVYARNGISRSVNDIEVVSHSELKDAYGFCSEGEITDIECREAATDLDYTETGERSLRCDLQKGFRCRGGRRQISKFCKDYKIRYHCSCSSTDVCNESNATFCLDTGRPISFPETEEELKTVCLNLQNVFRCLRYHSAKCGSDSTKEVQEFQMYSGVLTEICRKDTRLHSKVVKDLRCLKNIFDHDEKHCQRFAKLSMNYLYQEVLKLSQTSDDVYYTFKVFPCLFEAIHSNCMAVQTLENCGSRAKDTVLKIMEKAKVLENKCPTSIKKDILKLLGMVATVAEQEIHVEKILINCCIYM